MQVLVIDSDRGFIRAMRAPLERDGFTVLATNDGLSGSTSFTWVTIHKLASMLTLGLLAVKLVLHRTWIAKVVKRLFVRKGKRAQVEHPSLAYERVAVSSSKSQ